MRRLPDNPVPNPAGMQLTISQLNLLVCRPLAKCPNKQLQKQESQSKLQDACLL